MSRLLSARRHRALRLGRAVLKSLRTNGYSLATIQLRQRFSEAISMLCDLAKSQQINETDTAVLLSARIGLIGLVDQIEATVDELTSTTYFRSCSSSSKPIGADDD